MNINDESGRTREKHAVASLNEISRHSLDGTEENHKKPSYD